MVAYNFATTAAPKILPKVSAFSPAPKKKSVFLPTVSSAPVKHDTAIERPNINTFSTSLGVSLPKPKDQSGDIFQTGTDFFSSILTGAVKMFENIPSVINQASAHIMGSPEGIIDTAAREIGKTPVGDLARAADTVLSAGFKIVGAAANQNFAGILRDTAHMPDSAPLNLWQGSNLPGWLGTGLIGAFGPGTGGLSPFLAPLGLAGFGAVMAGEGDIKTVGDFRRVAAERGFTDEDVQGMQNGTKNLWDFGDKKISTNPLVDMGIRVVYDPSNLVFMGGPSILKLAGHGAAEGLKMTGAGRDVMAGLIKAGRSTKWALDSTAAGTAIAEGRYAQASWAGVGSYLKGAVKIASLKYAKASIATTGALVATDFVTGAAADKLGTATPLGGLLNDLHGLSSDIINDRPLSESAMFGLIAAVNFPLHGLAKDAKGVVKVGTSKTLAGEGASYALLKHIVPENLKNAPVAEQLAWGNANMRGGMGAIVNIIDRKIAYNNLLRDGMHQNHFTSIAEAAKSVAEIDAAVTRRVETMRSQGLITNRMREQTWVDWNMESRGVTGEAMRERQSGMKLAYDRDRAVRAWNEGSAVGTGIAPVLREFGDVTWGLRDRVTTESIDIMKMTVKDYADANGVIDAAAMRRFITDHPEVATYMAMSKGGNWWLRFEPGNNAPSTNVRALRNRLDGLKSYVTDSGDVFKAATGQERAAPPPPRDFKPLITRVKDNDSYAVGEAMATEFERIDKEAQAGVVPDTYDRYLAGEVELNWDQSILNEVNKGTLTQDDLAKLAPYQKVLEDYGAPYTLKISPDNPLVWDSAGHVDARLLEHGALAQLVMDHGWLSAPARFMDWLTHPVTNHQLYKDSRQAVYNEAVGKYGLKAASVDQLFRTLQRKVEESKLAGVGLFRSADSLMPSYIEEEAASLFFKNKSDGLAYAKMLEAGDSFASLMDRAGTRFWRSLQDRIESTPTGRLSRALETMDATYAKTQKTFIGKGTRLVGKTFYPIFRFSLDPRWWAMNYLEADMLAGFEYGFDAAAMTRGGPKPLRSEMQTFVDQGEIMPKQTGPDWGPPAQGQPQWDVATATHHFGHPPKGVTGPKDAITFDQGGMMFRRNLAGRESITFQRARKIDVMDFLHSLATDDPFIATLRSHFGDDASAWVKGIDNMLYQFDTKGVEQAIMSDARKVFSEELLSDPNFSELLSQIVDRNQKTYDGIVNTFAGNASRSNLERTLNSYWLYWPISYQLKAGKWLFDVFTKKGIFGDNLAGAYWWNHVQTQVTDMVANDPEYQQYVKDMDPIFMLAQQLFPISPVDLSLSLSRAPRYVGGWLGLWPPYNSASDPISLAGLMFQMGPLYTANMLKEAGAALIETGVMPNFNTLLPAPAITQQ
jgi:hypothetical protein